jgi:transglutaminase-like putative cysteine protease
MRINTTENRQIVLNAIIYIGSFILFWEWLRPLEQITDTENIFIFVLYTAFCFFLSYMQLKWWITSPLKLLGLLFILDGLFFYDGFLSKIWIQTFIGDIKWNVSAMLSQNWWDMTPLFRSLLFLVLLWLMSYLLYYWFVVAKRVLFFVVLTFIYITIIDTFTAYDAKFAIVRSFLVAMIIVGITSFQRVLLKEKIFRVPKEKYGAWILPLISIILVSGLLGFIAPKFSPQWPDPVPFFKSAAETVTGGGSGSGSGIQKVGYGENDEQLGGSFVQDETVVFRAQVRAGQYWKIETKDVYTGKGWVRSDDAEPFIQSVDGTIDMLHVTGLVEKEEQSAELIFNKDEVLPKLAYPYGLKNIQLEEGSPLYLTYREESNEVYARVNDQDAVSLDEYSVTFDQPTYSLKALREVTGEDPEDIMERYTQLPGDLPTRLENLAIELTQGKENRYDQAKAIESYFTSRRLQYRTTNIPVPAADEDYVDKFIFETQAGYCDNFSTSMVVLLRTLDIPARWVKGFAPGERIDSAGNGVGVYEVTNSNAHSWVEVYFPQIGWVPFEPTPGFYNPVDFSSGLDLEELLEQARDNMDMPVTNPEPTTPDPSDDEGASKDKTPFFMKIDGKYWAIAGVVLLFMMGNAYWKRFRWLSWFKLRKYRSKTDIETFMKAYKFLLALLANKGIKMNTDQTLREFALVVDDQLNTSEMKRLTNHYERILYREDPDKGQWGQLSEAWESLVKLLAYKNK